VLTSPDQMEDAMDSKIDTTVSRTPRAPVVVYRRRWAAALVMMVAALMDLIATHTAKAKGVLA